MTREEAIKVLNMVEAYGLADEAKRMAIEALEQEPCDDCISRKHLLSEISDLKKSPWFNYGKDEKDFRHEQYNARKEAVEVVEDLCIKKELSVQPIRYDYVTKNNVITTICQYGTSCERAGKVVMPMVEVKQNLVDLIDSLPSVQPKEIYNKGWKDGAEATAYHAELCEKENPTIPMSVIEDIKAELQKLADDEWNQNVGNYAQGMEDAIEIIDRHIAERNDR